MGISLSTLSVVVTFCYSAAMIREVIIPITGFTQSGARFSGLERLWHRAREGSSKTRWVLPPVPWKADPEHWAGLIARNVSKDVRVSMIAYSWGAGWQMPRLCDALGRHGIEVEVLGLIDPVYRGRWLPTWLPLNILSILNIKKVRIPANVREVVWMRQTVDKPRGHDLKAESPTTIINAPTILDDRGHSLADDYVPFHDEFLALVNEGRS